MRYRDLVNFQPIESVVQLREVDDKQKALEKVAEFVISDRMADQLANIVFPQLQFAKPLDNKGVLIVGNYGTGKSHLMAVITSIAEHGDIVSDIQSERVRNAATDIAGKFMVTRVELGAVTGTLRDILLRELESAFSKWGILYKFPKAEQIATNKDAIIDAMGVFSETFPDKGLFLAVDELLDFLRTRDERQIIYDLGFLRELGEVAQVSRFRFMAGLQETLFDNPRFAFVADQLRRVRDRFEQVSIVRNDIAYVVANRLLKKSDEQIALAHQHLQAFAPLYTKLNENIGEFARLFPIHPAFIDTFQNIRIAERREVLRTFSNALKNILDDEVPSTEPGLVSYDRYWQVMRENHSLRSIEDISEVLDKSGIVKHRVEQNFGRPKLLPMALRVIEGLGVHRLTSESINDPIGATPEELRDNLCLYVEMPVQTASAEFLRDQVQVTLNEIMRTVSGQYISHIQESNQYYLDVRKDIDFDEQIRERGASLSTEQLDRYFFDALGQVLGFDSSKTYVSTYRIWFTELPWHEKRVNRSGYFFFGTPAERSTAQPRRDFYLYVIPPFSKRDVPESTEDDEVLFSMHGISNEVEQIVRQYAGAREQQNASPSHQKEYGQKAEEFFKRLARWLNESLGDHLVVHHQGVRQSLDKALARVTNTQSQSIYELIRLISSTKLAPFWNEQFPNYPAFTRLSQPVTEASRKSNASEALRLIGGQGGTALGRGVLAGLGLLDEEDTIRPHLSPYAQQYLELLKSKGAGKVVNRNDVIEMVADSIDHPIERDRLFQIEPEWVAVILAALTYAGDIVITVDRNEMIDASSIDKLVMKPVDSITRFQHFGAPKDVPIGIWEQIFEHFGLASGTIRDSSPAAREAAVKALQIEVSKRQSYLIELQTRISQGFNLWNEPVFTDNFHLVTERGAIVGSDHPEVPLLSTKLLVDIRAYVKHLSELAKVNTVGKLRNLSLNSADVYEMKQQSKTVERAQRLIQLVTEFQPQVAYLAEAQAILPADHSWIIEAESAKRELLANIRYFGGGQVETSAVTTLSGSLADLKRRYTEIYTELHTAARLSKSDDDRKAKLASDARLITLKELAKIDLFSKSQGELTAWSTATGGLKTCTSFYPELLEHSPKCEHCKFVPAQESSTNPAGVRLKTLDNRLDDLFASWHNVLRTALNSETATTSLCNMTAAERAPIELFLKQQPDEPSLPPSFIKSATGALEGISSVAISEEALVAALRAGGLPATPADLRMRFESLLSELLKGHDSKSTRIGIQATIGSNQS